MKNNFSQAMSGNYAYDSPLAKWRVQSANLRSGLGVSNDYKPWTSVAKCTGIPQRRRYYDVLDLAWCHRMQEVVPGTTRAEAAANCWCEPTQMVGRKPWSVGLRCLLQGSHAYSFEHDFCLSGYDALRLQGAPLQCAPQDDGPTSFSDANIRSLAGEAFSAPIATCVAYAYFLNPHAAWWQG